MDTPETSPLEFIPIRFPNHLSSFVWMWKSSSSSLSPDLKLAAPMVTVDLARSSCLVIEYCFKVSLQAVLLLDTHAQIKIYTSWETAVHVWLRSRAEGHRAYVWHSELTAAYSLSLQHTERRTVKYNICWHTVSFICGKHPVTLNIKCLWGHLSALFMANFT